MNKIVIVGHPNSGLEEVESLLYDCGMKHAMPSRREGMTPHDITQALLKAHRCQPIEQVLDENEFAPLDVGTVWHGMALDLMLGNLEQNLWGWTDPSAIYLLEYWRTLDPSLLFVLVYGDPASAPLSLSLSASDNVVSDYDVNQEITNWAAYNSALLSFHLRHPERCMLASVEQIRYAVDTYLQELGQKLDLHLQLPNVNDSETKKAPSEVIALTVPKLNVLLNNADEDTINNLQASELDRYLINQILQKQPTILQLYEELQSAASLPPLSSIKDDNSPQKIWHILQRHRASVAHLLSHVQLNGTQLSVNELKEENELLLLQLHQLQEELERHYLHNKKNEESLITSNGLKEENELLLLQLHQVQEELEHYYLLNIEKEGTLATPSGNVLNSDERNQSTPSKAGFVSKLVELLSLSLSRKKQLIKQSGFFDEAWYLQQYPDVAESGIDPVKHYLRFGAKELRNPSQKFDTKWYLEQYPDVVKVGINPLYHYIRFGQHEARKPSWRAT